MTKGLIALEGQLAAGEDTWGPEQAALVPVANRTLLSHAIDTVRRAGAAEIVVVGEMLLCADARDVLGAEGDGVRWLMTGASPDLPAAILAAADFLGDDRFIVHAAEALVTSGHDLLAEAAAGTADAAVFFADERLAGVHVFSRAIHEHIAAIEPDPGGGRSLAEAVDHLADAGGTVRAGVIPGYWRYRAQPAELLEVNRLVLDTLEPSSISLNLADARVEGRVQVHPTARIRNAVIRGPAIIGAHARVTDAYVGPYTAIGDRAAIENAEISASIVLPGARIRHVGVRVEDSIVGANATVGRDFSLPKAMRVLVGRDAQISLG